MGAGVTEKKPEKNEPMSETNPLPEYLGRPL